MTNLANATNTSTRSVPAGALRLVGTVGTAAGLLGALHVVLLVAYPAAVTENSHSFPFHPGGLLNGQWSGHTPQILVSVTLWVAIPLAAGLIRTVRRGSMRSGDRVFCVVRVQPRGSEKRP